MTAKLRVVSVVAIVFALGLSGCSSSKKKRRSSVDHSYSSSGGTELKLNGDSDSGTAGGLRTVHFSFNSAALSSNAKEALKANANYLNDNSGIEVQIEGHCDERGGVQYNLALGEKRAIVTKQYLISMGVSSSRLTTISFGKERPVAFGHSEDYWSQNRRSNFVVTSR